MILVVDDDAQIREYYTSALRMYGYDVVAAPDGSAALEIIKHMAPGLVVLDLDMPRVDGWTVLRELAARESTRAVPVIVVTGEENADQIEGAAAACRKPVPVDRLLSLVASYQRAA